MPVDSVWTERKCAWDEAELLLLREGLFWSMQARAPHLAAVRMEGRRGKATKPAAKRGATCH